MVWKKGLRFIKNGGGRLTYEHQTREEGMSMVEVLNALSTGVIKGLIIVALIKYIYKD